MLEVVKLDMLSPSSYCFYCKHPLKPGEEIRSVPMQCWKWGKQRRKLKGEHTRYFHAHLEGECK